MAIYEPKITAVTLTPNPVNINAPVTVAVSVTEVEIVLYRVYGVSGALRSGQSVNLNTRKEVS